MSGQPRARGARAELQAVLDDELALQSYTERTDLTRRFYRCRIYRRGGAWWATHPARSGEAIKRYTISGILRACRAWDAEIRRQDADEPCSTSL